MPNRILIVEDEPDILALLTFNLEAQGYQVLTATDGKEGYHKASTGNIDLLLLDLMLPKMHGINVCQKLRSQPQTLKLPIIMLSALGDEEDIVAVQKEYIRLADLLWNGTEGLAPKTMEDRDIFELLGFD